MKKKKYLVVLLFLLTPLILLIGNIKQTNNTNAIYLNSYAMKNNSIDYLKKNNLEIQSEGTVLLKNSDFVLPLDKQKTKLSIFSTNSYDINAQWYIKRFKAENDLSFVLQKNGWDINSKLNNLYKKHKDSYKSYWRYKYDWDLMSSKPNKSNEMPYTIIDSNKDVVESFNEYNTAIFTLTRGAGEGRDVPSDYLLLTKEEIELLNYINSKFNNIIVLINSSNPLPLNWINDYQNIKAVLNIGMPGAFGLETISDILEGKINPSGKLSDTYAYDFSKSPSAINYNGKITNLNEKTNSFTIYQEGIYVGYKYYETRYFDKLTNMANVGSFDYEKEVQFPFGYGLSYTNFLYSNFEITNDTDNNENTIDLSVNIENIGQMPGKEVVQLYLQKPYTQYDKDNLIEKPAIELIDFDKTKLLNPGESQDIEFHIDKEIFKVYDANKSKTYIDESGKYYFAVGQNAHDSLNNIIERIYPNLVNANENLSIEYDHKTKTNENVDSITYSKNKNGFKITNLFDMADINYYDYNVKYLSRNNWQGTMPNSVLNDGKLIASQKMINEIKKLDDYKSKQQKQLEKRGGLDSNTEQNLKNKLEYIIYGGNREWFDKNKEFNFQYMDGPTGDHDSLHSSSLPVQASTFNKELINQFGQAMGQYSVANYKTYWYGISANIHRNYLNGRHLEYYSEDSFLSSVMGAQAALGAKYFDVGLMLKHLVLNETEDRYGIYTFINEQALREIYLKPFEFILKNSKIDGIMGSFNRIGIIWSNIYQELMNNWLRGEVEYSGFISTDYYQGHGSYQDVILGLINNSLNMLCAVSEAGPLINEIMNEIKKMNSNIMDHINDSYDKIMNSYTNVKNSKVNFEYNYQNYLNKQQEKNNNKWVYWLIPLISIIFVSVIVATTIFIMWQKGKLFRK